MTDQDDEDLEPFFLDEELEDFSEPADDFVSEHHQSKRDDLVDGVKKRKFPYFVFCSLLVASGLGFFYFYSDTTGQSNFPVVKIPAAQTDVKATPPESPVVRTDNVEIEGHADESNILPLFAEDLYESDANKVVFETPDEAILTPLPSLDDKDEIIALPALDNSLDDQDNEQMNTENDTPEKAEDLPRIIVPTSSQTKVNMPPPAIKEVFVDQLEAVPPGKQLSSSQIKKDVVVPKKKPVNTQYPSLKSDSSPKDSQRSVQAPKPKKIQSANLWVIKAILPGKAVVHNTNTGETRSVEAGDIIASVGTIRSITQKNGRWIVVGSKGNILQ